MRRDIIVKDTAYLKFIRSKPCCICGTSSQPRDADHLIHRGWREAKRNDETAVPLCRMCHIERHKLGGDVIRGVNLWREVYWLRKEFTEIV